MAIHFPDTGELLNYGSGSVFDDNELFTFILWFNARQVDQTNMRLMYKGSPIQIHLGQFGGENGIINASHNYSGTNARVRTDADTIVVNTWTYMAWFMGGATVQSNLWLGSLTSEVAAASLQNQTTATGTITSDAGDDLTVGGRIASGASDAYIANLWMYDVELSLDDIKKHQFDPNYQQANCIARGDFFDQSTRFIRDLSGNGNDPTIGGTPLNVPHPPLPYGIGTEEPPYADAVATTFPPELGRRHDLPRNQLARLGAYRAA